MSDAQQTKRTPRGRRRAGRWLMGALLALWALGLGLLTALILALASGWRPDLMERLLEELIPRLTRHELRIVALEGSLLEGLVAHEVSLVPVASPDAAPLHASRVSLRVDVPASLRRQRLVLAEAEVEGLRLVLWREQGRTHVQGLGIGEEDPAQERDGAPVPFALAIETLSIRDLGVDYQRDEQARFGPLSLAANGTIRGFAWRVGRPLPWPRAGQLDLELHALALRGVDLGRGRATIVARRSDLQFEQLELTGGFGRIAGRGAIAASGPVDHPRLAHAQASLQLERLDVGRLREQTPADAPPLSSLNGDLELRLVRPQGAGASSPHLLVEASLGPSAVLDAAIDEARLAGRYRIGDGSWRLRELDLLLPAGRLTARGHGTRDELGQLVVSAADLDLARLPRDWLPLEIGAGRAALDVDLTGSYRDPTGSLSLRGSNLRIGRLGPGDLLLGLTALGERHYRLDVFEATFGEDERTRSERYLRSKRPAALHLIEDGAEVRDLELTWPGGALEVSGGVQGEALLPTTIALHELELEVAERLAGLDWQSGGRMSGDLRVDGPLATPRVEARLLWQDAKIGAVEADRVGLEVDADESRVRLVAEVFAASREQLRLVARLPRDLDPANPRALLADERAQLEVRATEFDVEALSPLLQGRGISIGGFLDGSVSGSGGAPQPRLDGALNVRDGRLLEAGKTPRGARLLLAGPLNGRLAFRGNALEIVNMRAGSESSELVVDAQIRWVGPRADEIEFEARLEGIGFKGELELAGALSGDVLEPSVVSLSNFDAAELGRLAGVAMPLDGQLWAELELSGEATDPLIEMSAAWEEPRIGKASAERLRLDAAAQDDELLIYAHVVRDGRMALSVDGRLPLELGQSVADLVASIRAWPQDPRSTFDIKATDVTLDWLPLLAPRFPVKSRGLVEGTVQVQGSDPLPLVTGELRLQGALFSLAGQRAKAGPLDGVVRFEGTSAHFDRLILAAGKGQATIAGDLGWGWGGLTDVRLEIGFEKYLFDQLGLLRTYLDGSLNATGPLDAMHVTGSIQLSDVRVSFPSQQDPVLKEIRVLGLPDSSRAASITEGETEIAGLSEKTSVDVSLVMPPGTWVRGMGLDAEIVGKVRVTKQPREALVYQGDFVVQHGRYTLQGKRFELERGVAVFVADQGAIPDVDILATRNVSRDVRVTAHLTGRADAMNLELTSNPPMDTAEIISYVFFGGVQRGDIDQNGTQFQGTAASLAGMLLFDSIPPEMRETLRIDKIGVTSGEEGVPAVEIETQLTPDVYLRVIQSLGASGDEAVEVRWRFWRNLNLKSMVARSGSSSIDLLWAYDYWGLERFGLGGLREPPPPYRAEPRPAVEEAPLCRPPERCDE